MKWENVELGTIAKIDWGNTNLTKSCYVKEGKYLAVSATGPDGLIDYYEHEEDTTVISAIGANCGKVFFPSKKFTAIKNTMTVKPNASKIHKKYLFWALSNSRFNIRGAGQPFLSKADTEKLDVMLPPLHIQELIADTLDKADALRRRDQELLSKYDELAQAIFFNMFGDLDNDKITLRLPLSELCYIPSNLIDPRKPEYSNLLHVGGDNIMSNIGKIHGCKKASELGLISGKFLFDEKMILYNKIRPKLNKVAMPNFIGICSADMYPILPNTMMTKEFLYSVLTSKSFLNFAESQSRRANIPKINRKELFSYSCIVPSLEKQIKYSDIFKQLCLIKDNIYFQINYSEDLFNKYTAQYF